MAVQSAASTRAATTQQEVRVDASKGCDELESAAALVLAAILPDTSELEVALARAAGTKQCLLDLLLLADGWCWLGLVPAQQNNVVKHGSRMIEGSLVCRVLQSCTSARELLQEP